MTFKANKFINSRLARHILALEIYLNLVDFCFVRIAPFARAGIILSSVVEVSSRWWHSSGMTNFDSQEKR